MTTTTDLVKRLEAGETGREIEVAIFHALSSAQMPASIAIDSVDAQWNWLSYFHSGWTNTCTSLDAAVALVERVLPDNCWDVQSAHRKVPAYATIFGATNIDETIQACAPTPAAALVAALLKANGGGG